MNKLAIVNGKGELELLSIAEVMDIIYFDIPSEDLGYSTYSKQAYYDHEIGWYMMDADGYKHYESSKHLTILDE